MKILPVKETDLPQVTQLAYAIWPVAYADILSKAQLQYMLDKFYSQDALSQQLHKGHQFFVIQNEEGRNLGFVAFELNCEPHQTKIHKIYVLPETQGLGLGKKLFEKVKEEAVKAHQNAIFLNVNKYNKAQHFYSKLGFTIIKDEVIDIGQGYVMDDYVMKVSL